MASIESATTGSATTESTFVRSVGTASAATVSSPATGSGRDGASAGEVTRCTIIRLRGEHDIATTAALWQTLERAIALDDVDMVIDLSEVRFMDASTIGVILRAGNALRPRSLTLRSPQGITRRLLDICALTHLIDGRPAAVLSPAARAGPTTRRGQ